MGKHKMDAMYAVYMEKILDKSKMVVVDGKEWPYMVNNRGLIWALQHIPVQPYIDSKTGVLMHTLRNITKSDEIQVSLALIMANAYLPNEKGYKNAKVKSGDPSSPSSYYIENIEWCDENGIIDNATVIANSDASIDRANVACCRALQGRLPKDIAKELNLTVDEVRLILDANLPGLKARCAPNKDPKTTRMAKSRNMRSFIVYLINTGMSKPKIKTELAFLIAEANDKQLDSIIRTVGRTDARVKPKYRCK